MALTVELFGLPGAGKTTLGRALQKWFEERGIHTPRLRDRRCVEPNLLLRHCPVTFRRAAYLLNAVMQPRALSELVRLSVVSSRQPAAQLPFLLGVLAALRFYRNCERSPLKLVLFDQGLLQSVWSLGVLDAAASGEQYSRAVCALRGLLPHVLVVLDIDVDTAAARIQQRAGDSSRFDRLPAEQLAAALPDAQRSVHEVAAAWQRMQGRRLVYVDATRSIDVLINQIGPPVLDLLSNQARG